jgi:DNA adenine methylase
MMNHIASVKGSKASINLNTLTMQQTTLKTPISYYGGKQKLCKCIIQLIPKHNLYCEPFIGGAAVFFAKEPSAVEVINDINSELINFYRVVQNDFTSLEREVRISLHSRRLHKDAQVIYDNPHMFSDIKRAWALWMLANQSFSSMLDASWGYDIKKKSTSVKIHNKREAFTEDIAIRLQNVQIECTDALRIINSRDKPDSFFYCDPPYFNSDCGHYNGYTKEDFESLLQHLSKIEGKFLLSSYPSDMLKQYVEANAWHQKSFDMEVSVNKGNNGGKRKTEVLTANFEIK